MPEGITLKRIIDMDETQQLSSSDYVLVDSSSGGNRKYNLGEDLNNLKDDFAQYVYEVELDTLNDITPFNVNTGDVISIKSKDGSAITVATIRFRRSNGTDDYWTISGYTERKLTMEEPFVGVYINGGTAQEIIVSNLSNPYNFNPQLDAMGDKVDSLQSAVYIGTVTPSNVNTGFIHRDGRIMEGSNFRYTNPIKLVNERISFVARGYSNAVSLLSLCDENGENRINIVNSTDDSNVTVNYESDGETYVIISSLVSVPISYTTTKINNTFDKPYTCLSLFNKFGVIGDSYASGCLFYNGTSKDDYTHSWGQIMARKLGTVCTNYSKGGLSTRTWLTDAKGLPLVLTNEPEDIYYLALGINDEYSLGANYLGSLADITSHSSYQDYADSFYGNYGRIIEQIQAHAPHAKLVMFTLAHTNTTIAIQYSDAIIEIANHYEIPYIRQRDDPFFNSTFFWNNMVEGHPIAIGYSGMAEAFERLLNNCLRNNVLYFKDTFCYE